MPTKLKIPKKIFYIWVGGEKNNLTHLCIQNWKEKLPDYEIIEINSSSKEYFDFDKELTENIWFRFVYERGMLAYVADYIRIKVLYDNGGIYLDTDISVVKEFTPLLSNDLFLGMESSTIIASAIIGTIPQHSLLKEIIEFYSDGIWQEPIYTSPKIITKILKEEYKIDIDTISKPTTVNDITIYPKKYFYPYYYNEIFSPKCIENNTYTVHWWKASWVNQKNLFYLENKHKYSTSNLDKLYSQNFCKSYLFSTIPFVQIEEKKNSFNVKLFGIPILNVICNKDEDLYYLLKFIPFLRVKKYSSKIKLYLFFKLPLLRIQGRIIN